MEKPTPIFKKNELLDDLGDDTGADGTTALADGEAQTFVHGNRRDQADPHLEMCIRDR